MPPLSLLLNWRVWVAVALAASYYFVYTKGQESVQVDFDKYMIQQTKVVLDAQTAAREKEHSMEVENEKVTHDYESLKAATATAVGALDTERLRLQSVIASTHSGATSDPKAGPVADATPEDGVLGECLQRYEAVAGDAQALSDNTTGLQNYVNGVVKP